MSGITTANVRSVMQIRFRFVEISLRLIHVQNRSPVRLRLVMRKWSTIGLTKGWPTLDGKRRSLKLKLVIGSDGAIPLMRR